MRIKLPNIKKIRIITLRTINRLYRKPKVRLVSIIFLSISLLVGLFYVRYLIIRTSPNSESVESTAKFVQKSDEVVVGFGEKGNKEHLVQLSFSSNQRDSTLDNSESRDQDLVSKVISVTKEVVNPQTQPKDVALGFSFESADKVNNEGLVESSFECSQADCNVEFEKDGDKFINNEVIDGVDLEYEIIDEGSIGGVKENIIISEKSENLPNSFIFNIEKDEEVVLHQSLTKSPKYPDGGYYFADKNGGYLAHFEPLFAVDSDGEETTDLQFEIIDDFIRITLDSEWLNSESRKFPVYIDPTIVHDTQSEFASGSLNRLSDQGSGDSSPKVEMHEQAIPTNDNGLVALWNMDNDWNDSSGNGNNGTAENGVTFSTSAKLGSHAGSFDGTDDYVSVLDSSDFDFGTGAFAISFWFYSMSSSRSDIITIKSPDGTDDFGILLNDNNIDVYFKIDGSGGWCISGTELYSLNSWHNVIFIRDHNGGIGLYLDGNLDSVGNSLLDMDNNTGDLWIGANKDSSSNPTLSMLGYLDDVAMYSRALTQEEVRAISGNRPSAEYVSPVIDLVNVNSWVDLAWTEKGVSTGTGETPYSTTDIVAQWNFNETSGTTANNDAEGSSCGGTPANCDGTLTNFASTGSQDAAVGSGWTSDNRRWGAGALMFDGSNDYINIGTNSSLDLTGLSVEAWIKTSQTSAGTILSNYSSGKGYIFAIGFNDLNGSTPGLLSFYSSGGAWKGSTRTINDSEWHHVVVTNSSNTTRFYIDGMLDSTESQGSPLVNTGGAKYIGQYGATNYFSGIMDTVRVYDRVLSSDEILSNYNSSNIQFQTRVGDTSTPDATWGDWKSNSGETQILSLDSDADDWNSHGSINLLNQDSDLKLEGTASLVIEPRVSSNVHVFTADYDLGDDTDFDSMDIVINSGVTVTMHGTHTFAELDNQGTIVVSPYDGTAGTGDLYIKADVIESSGVIDGSGRGYGGGGGGGAGTYEYHAGDGGNSYAGGGGGGAGGTSTGYSGYCPNGGTGGVATGGGSSASDSTGGCGPNSWPGTVGGDGDLASTGGTQAGNTSGGGGGGGGGSYGADGGAGSNTGNGANGSNGGYLSSGGNGDSSTDFSVQMGSGGGGGGGSQRNNTNGTTGVAGSDAEGLNGGDGGDGGDGSVSAFGKGGGGGGGGGSGGASIRLYADSEMIISGSIKSNGGAGGAGGVTESKTGGSGGGGGGGGISLNSPSIDLTSSTIQSKGNALDGSGSTTNGGSVKVFYDSLTGSLPSSANVGRIYSSDFIDQTYSVSSTDTFGLVYLPLDETNGDLAGDDVFDLSSNNYDGEITGTTVVKGIKGYARNFDGNDDCINLGDVDELDSPSALTVSMWFRRESDNNLATAHSVENVLISQTSAAANDNFEIGTDGGAIDYYLDSPTAALTKQTKDLGIENNRWYHIGVTYDSTLSDSAELKFYLDGQLVFQDDSGGGALDSSLTSPLAIGGSRVEDGISGEFDGDIDEVFIVDSAMSSEQIYEIYKNGNSTVIERSITSTDLSSKSLVALDIASDTLGTFGDISVGENGYVQRIPDSNTVGLWTFDDAEYMFFSDDFSTDTSANYNWINLDTNTPTNSHSYDSVNDWVEIRTGDNDYENLYEYMELPANGYAKIVMVKRTDYPTANDQDFTIYQDANNYYEFDWCGSSYSNQGVIKTVNGSTVNSSLEAGTVDTDDATYTIEAWWTPNMLRLDINGTNRKLLNTTDQTEIIPKYFRIQNMQADTDLSSIEIYGLDINRDLSESGNDAYFVGGTTDVGIFGNAVSLDGSDDYVNLGTDSSLDFDEAITISMWIKPNNLTANEFLLGGSASTKGYSLRIDDNSADNLEFYLGDGSTYHLFTYAHGMVNGNWYNVVAKYDESTGKASMYVNGVLIGSTTDSFTVDGGVTYGKKLGSDAGGAGNFDGLIDQVEISNVARTADEIRQMYEIGMRSHLLTTDFVSTPSSFDIKGTSEANALTDTEIVLADDGMINKIFNSEIIIVKENYGGTLYIVQGEVTGVNSTTRTITVSSFSGTVPNPGTSICGGSDTHCFTSKATVFKWQREYLDISSVLNEDVDGVTNISLKILPGTLGRSIWIDDVKSVSSYMTDPSGSTISSATDNQYFQYRAVYTTTDPSVSAYLEDVTLDYASNNDPTNTSVTLTNPYEGDGNDVFPDGSSEWTFRATVGDLDGYTDIDTVTLKLADAEDNTDPYDDLQFLWTRSSDTFTEVGGHDANSAVTISSDSGDSSCDGNQCILDFKLVFSDTFVTKSVDYNTQLITVDSLSATDTDTYSSTYQVHPGYVVQNATTFDVILTSDWNTSVETDGQVEVKEVGIEATGGNRVAKLSVDFSSSNLDWSGMSADSNTSSKKAFMHYSGGFPSIPGASGSSYSLYVPKSSDDSFVGICPGASSLTVVGSDCDDLITYREADSNVSVENIGGSDFWVIDGLTNTGGFSFSTFGGGLELRNVQSVRIDGTTYLVSATSGGVSVTNETDWTEYDSSYNSLVYKAVVSDNGDLYYLTSEKDLRVNYDITSLTDSFVADHTYSGTTDPAITGATVDLNNIIVTTGTSAVSAGDNTIYVATDGGLVVIQEDQTEETNGSVKYYTKDYVSEELIGDIIAAYSFNGTEDSVISNSSSITDISVNSHDGTTSDGSDSSMTYVSGIRGTGVDLDGEDDSISLGTSTDYDLSSYSIGGWFKTTAKDNFGVITSKNTSALYRNWWVSIWSSSSSTYTAGSLDFRTSTSGASDIDLNSSKDLADGFWHHFVVILDGSTAAYMYVDGILVDSDTPSGAVSLSNTAAIIGNGPETTDRYFDGSIDEFFITSEVLTDSDVERIYSVGRLALQAHDSRIVDGIESDCGLQEISGSTNIITSLSVDDNNSAVYLGTYDSGISEIGLQTDSLVKVYNTDLNIRDDFNMPWNDNAVDALWFSGEMDNDAKESSLVVATDSGVWLESSDISLYSALRSASSPTVIKDEVYAQEINVHGDVLPSISNEYNLGSASLYWNSVYSDELFGKNTSLQSFDLAENYLADNPDVMAGDVVTLASLSENSSYSSISKSVGIYENGVIGVVSTKPAITLGEIKDAGEDKSLLRPVALAGRVPVKVSTENGDIQKGDFLVAASEPGYAMKACGDRYCKSGFVIGLAMEDFGREDLGDSESVQNILREANLDNQELINDLQEEVNYLEELGETDLNEQDLEIIEEVSSELVEESNEDSLIAGKGRIMLYVDLMWYDPESDESIESRLLDMEQTLSGLLSGGWVEEGSQLSTPLDVKSNSITATSGSFGVLRLGELGIAQDRFFVDSLGNVSTSGDLTISGTISGRYGDLGLRLGDVEGSNKFIIRNESGEEVASVDSMGKFSARKIKVQGEDASSGSAVFNPDERLLYIESPMINSESKVFVSIDFADSTLDMNRDVAVNKVEDGSFSVFLSEPSEDPVKFDWWVIN